MQPQQPHSPDVPATAPAAPRPPRIRTSTVVVSLAAGLALGAAGVGAAWALSGGDGGGSTPAGDARAACQALDGFDEAKYSAKGPEGEVALNRYAAAGALSASAAAADAAYEPLAQAVRRSQDRHARVFDFDAKVMQDLDEARRICGTL